MEAEQETRSITSRVTLHQQAGTVHLEQNAASEDAALCLETPALHFYGLADGQSGQPYSRLGGKLVLRTLANLILRQGIAALRAYPYQDELQYQCIRAIRQSLTACAAQYATELAAFSSTLVLFAYTPDTGEYLLMHLGDGGILGVQTHPPRLHLLSAPENGITARYTWLTTSQNALSHLRIRFGTLAREQTRVLLFTDGVSALCHGKNIPFAAQQLLLANPTPQQIATWIQESRPRDDASCMIVDFAQTKP